MNFRDEYKMSVDKINMSKNGEEKIMDAVLERERKQTYSHTLRMRPAYTMLIVLLITCVMGFTAYSLGWLDAFTSMFKSEEVVNDMPESFDYMDLTQIEQLGGSVSGRVVEDDDVAIDIIGVIGSQNRADVLIDITLKNEDSASGLALIPPQCLIDGAETDYIGGWETVPQDESAANQQRFHFSVLTTDDMSGETLSFVLQGDATQSQDVNTQSGLFNNGYELVIPLDFGSAEKVVLTDKVLPEGRLLIAVVSPLSCVLDFELEAKDAVLENWATGLQLHMADGSVVDWHGHFVSATAAEDDDVYRCVYAFRVPLDPAEVVSITFNGAEIK